jgi:hypothetical protein
MILCALFCTACFSPWKSDEGIVNIRIGGDIAGSRHAWFDDKIIPYLKHTVTLEGPGSTQIMKDIEYGKNVKFSVMPGIWNISVIAEEVHLSQDEEIRSFFAAGSDSVIIKPGQNNINIKMKQENEINIINTGTGTFRWDIKYSVYISSAAMTITPLSDNAAKEIVVPFEIIYEGNSNAPNPKPNVGSLKLNTGYYRVVINIIGANAQEAEFNEILHIFKDKESVLEYEFVYSDFNERG